jgi:FkbM family methyltransferase
MYRRLQSSKPRSSPQSRRLRSFVKRLWPIAHVLRTLRYIRDVAPLKLSAPMPTRYGFKLLTPRYGNMKIGSYEDEELSCLHRVALAEGTGVLIDVGAHCGLYSCYALSKGLRAIAFEPLRRNLSYLYRNIFENGWQELCEIWPVAVTSRPGLQVLYDGGGGPAASLISGWSGMNPKFSSIVPTTSLDVAIGSRFKGMKLFVKIDVEGAELQVLRGASELLKSSPPPVWQIEICLSEWHPGGFNPNFRSVFELMASHGYEATTADDEMREIRLSDIDCWISKNAIPFSQREFLFKRNL